METVSDRTERQRAYQRTWHKAAYAKDPEKYRQRSETRRQLFRPTINSRRRELSAAKRLARLEQEAQNDRDKLGREPQTINEWFLTQAMFSSWAQLGRTVGVSRTTMLDWRTGKHPPVRTHRKLLYEITGLPCFADAANWKPREKPARKVGEKAAVPLLAELVVRSGLATRELQRIQVSQIKERGIQLDNGRIIPFGEGWEQVSHHSVDDWLERAKPMSWLFFSRKPVDRGQPASAVWISRALKAGGVTTQERRSARLRHFAGDFVRWGSGKRLLGHLTRVHNLSNSGARGILDALQRRKSLATGKLTGVSLDKAFDVLYRSAGRPATKVRIFEAASKLHGDGLSWPKIAQRLAAEEFAENPRRAAEALRKGVARLRT